MKRILAFSLSLTVLAAPSYGASKKELCAAVSGPMGEAASAMSGMYSSLSAIDYQNVADRFSTQERDQFLKLHELNSELKPVFLAFLVELENTALMLQRCSR